ncbi:MAG: hypothetical protein A2283_08220 [Lentisphaerae bacterium RIFOXYA12_FULL_48_11]|nr:MAG: hypothetical protein A2283_08220 [Lentisphaerae bacterium RIFOXYA12_FULL_48_11]
MKHIILYLGIILILSGCTSTRHSETYIPQDLEDCFTQLDIQLKPYQIAEMRKGSENDIGNYHFDIGMWIRNNWGLWSKSRLQTYFNNLGIYHPDTMSGIILTCYRRYLNQKPIGMKEIIETIPPQNAHCSKCGEVLQLLCWGGTSKQGYIFECINGRCQSPCLCTRNNGILSVVDFPITRTKAAILAREIINCASLESKEIVRKQKNPIINVPTWHNGKVNWYFRWSDGFPEDKVDASVDLYLDATTGKLVDLSVKQKERTGQ